MPNATLKTVAATAAFAAVHSLLASRGAKRLAERAVGARRRNAFYRPAYNAVAAVTTAMLVRYVARQPARTLYDVRGPAGGLMRAGQAVCAANFIAAVFQVGLGRLSGWANLGPWLRGERGVPRESEAQSLPPDAGGEIPVRGVFSRTRHPLNFFPVPLLWLNPRMTTTLAAFSAAASVYFYLGSLHSDRRLAARYGPAFEKYRSRVGLFLPGPANFPGKIGRFPCFVR